MPPEMLLAAFFWSLPQKEYCDGSTNDEDQWDAKSQSEEQWR
jgi:hypothetical protein